MRVITGSRRGQKLFAPSGISIRPTADGVKEAMFSAVQFAVPDSVVLDLFSGTGQLGIEALSRGAKLCVFVDSQQESIAATKKNLEKTKLQDLAKVHQMPSGVFLKTTRLCFDLAFLDPPYDRKLIQKTLPVLVEHMSPSGIIVCEHEAGCVLPETVGAFSLHKTRKHGKICITTYKADAADNLQQNPENFASQTSQTPQTPQTPLKAEGDN